MRHVTLLLALVFFSAGPRAFGLAQDRIGPDKDHDHPTHEQPGWPHGMVEILRHDSRVYSIWVNGNDTYYFQATPGDLGELVRLFSETRMRDHVVTIKSGGKPDVTPFNVPQPVPYNVKFHVLDGIALAMSRREGRAETFDPTLTIYVDPADDLAVLTQIPIPHNISLKSEIPNWPVKQKRDAPQRTLWHARLQFDSGKPATDFEGGVTTKVCYWEKDEEHPVALGSADRDGVLRAAFSEDEMADLRSGQAWLTMTLGNYLTAPQRDDPKLGAAHLALKAEDAKPVKVGEPGYYWGRILFEDGSPAVLDQEPWPGGQISLSFPFAGRAELDEEGYFKVYFTPAQFGEMKERKVSKNIYVPSFEDKGRSTALHAFPASELSLRKDEAGELRIAKPGPQKRE